MQAVRWLTGITAIVVFLIGGFTAAAFAATASGFSLGLESLIWWGPVILGPLALAAGAAFAGARQRVGLGLMIVGAVVVTPWFLYFGGHLFMPPLPHPMVLAVGLMAVALVIACDVAIVRAWITGERGKEASRDSSP